MLKEQIVMFIEDSIKKNWNIDALADYNGKSQSYSDIAEQILKLHLLFEKSGIKKRDKLALIGNNSANWAIVYLASITYGAVIVPILPDFGPDNIHHIVDHSDSIFFFASEAIWKNLDSGKMPAIKTVFSLESYQPIFSRDEQISQLAGTINELFDNKYSEGFSPEQISFPTIDNSDLALISYTSGTTGFSKGVMISHNSLTANVRYAHRNMPLEPGDSILSLLTIAHSFGMSFDFLFPFTLGCHITFLTKIPSLPVLMKAFDEIKPRLILLVPLLPEKIYKKQLVPAIKKPVMRVLLSIPGINQLIYVSIRKKISKVFGGNFHELVLGGAAFSKDAEDFFRKMKFPYTVGYGMTECGPLISYAPWNEAKAQSCGRVVDTLEVKIDSDDQQNKVGEIMVKGDNVMDGYYKNPEATKEVIDKDGWLHTGDLGVIDADGFIFIRGRNKSMILGPSGKNIYPEEIEAMINSRYYILESLVIEKDGQLVALICPDQERLKEKKGKKKTVEEIMEKYRLKLNKRFPSHVKISKFILHEEEFEKTPKKSLKRYLYQEKK